MNKQAEELVHHAFGAYLDFVVEDLVERGVTDADAIELVFEVATSLSEEGALPEFPDDTETWVAKARWLVAAKDLDFREFVREVLADG